MQTFLITKPKTPTDTLPRFSCLFISKIDLRTVGLMLPNENTKNDVKTRNWLIHKSSFDQNRSIQFYYQTINKLIMRKSIEHQRTTLVSSEVIQNCDSSDT